MTDVANSEIHGERPPRPASRSLFVVFFLIVAVLVVAGAILLLMRRGE